jgi:hypothetical protein
VRRGLPPQVRVRAAARAAPICEELEAALALGASAQDAVLLVYEMPAGREFRCPNCSGTGLAPVPRKGPSYGQNCRLCDRTGVTTVAAIVEALGPPR